MTTPAPTSEAPAAAIRKPIQTKRSLRYEFTNPERMQLGRDLAEAMTRSSQVDSDLTRVKTDFKARLSALESEMHSLRDKINTGYEIRDVECEWRFDDPKPNQKSLVRIDTGTVVEVQPMSEQEKQVELPFGEGDESKPEKEASDAPPPATAPKAKAARVGSGGVVAVPSDGKDVGDPDAGKAVN